MVLLTMPPSIVVLLVLRALTVQIAPQAITALLALSSQYLVLLVLTVQVVEELRSPTARLVMPVGLAKTEDRQLKELNVRLDISALKVQIWLTTKNALSETCVLLDLQKPLLVLKELTSLTLSKLIANNAPLGTTATRRRCNCLRSVLRVGSAELALRFTTLIILGPAPWEHSTTKKV